MHPPNKREETRRIRLISFVFIEKPPNATVDGKIAEISCLVFQAE